MKKERFRKTVGGILAAAAIMSAAGLSASAFDGPTHVDVTEKGIELFSDVTGVELSEEVKEAIIDGCTKPDTEENKGCFEQHFHNLDIGTNFSGKTNCAVNMSESHYCNAISLVKSEVFTAKRQGKTITRDKAMLVGADEFARAAHYGVEDMNTPVHTGNQTTAAAALGGAEHVSFENRCKDLQSGIKATTTVRDMQFSLDNSITNIAKDCASRANDLLRGMRNKQITQDEACIFAISNAIISVAGLINRYYRDVETLLDAHGMRVPQIEYALVA